MRRAFADPGFRLLFAATTTSMFGDSVMLLVFAMWVKELTGSNGMAGLTFFWLTVTSLLAPVLGGPIDRVRRRPLLVGANLASALMLAPLLLVHDRGDVWLIWLVSFLYGISYTVIPAGLNGLLKELLPEDLLVDANAGLQTVREGFRLVGPLIGAGLYAAFGGWVVAVVDAVTFALAAALIARIRLSEELPETEPSHWREDLMTGTRFIAADPVLRPVLTSLGVMLLVLGFSEASLFAVLDAFGKPVGFAGVLVTVQGIGAVAGGLTSSRVIRRLGEAHTVLVATVVLAVGLAMVAVSSWLPLFLASLVVFGVSLPWLLVALTTLMQVRTPQRIMGRVSTTMEVVLGTPQALSIAVGAALVSLLDYHVIFAIMASVTALAAAYLFVRLPARDVTPVVEPVSE